MIEDFFNLTNSYAMLPDIFYQKISPEPVKNPKLIKFNKSLSKELNIDPKKSMENGSLFFWKCSS